MKRFFWIALLLLSGMSTWADEEAADSTELMLEMKEVVVNGGIKQFGSLEAQPMSAQKILLNTARKDGIETLKGISHFVPNLFFPEYGSRLTSAIYIRGVGSRANTPAVGLYVDDVALMEKSSFDFSLMDAEHVEVLRGPQSTLYGRNTMGGLMKVYTPSPLQEGNSTQIRLGASTEDAMREAYVRHSQILTDGLGLSVSAFYKGDKGYNRNEYLDCRSNGGDSGGGKVRLTYQRSPRLSIDFQTSGEYSDEDAYDYYDVTTGLTKSNFLGNYRRTLINSSLKIETQQRLFTLSSVTAYQFVNDRMLMDQDYTSADIFKLEQKQRSHSFSEEVVIKGNRLSWLEWTGGAYFAHQSLHTTAPVTFMNMGVKNMIQKGIDSGFEKANAAMAPMGMNLAMTVADPELVIDGSFDTPTTNVAVFGQARLKDLLTRGLDLTAGLRLDYEHFKMDYETGSTTHFNFLLQRKGMPMPMVNQDFTTESAYEGSLSTDQTRVLPKLTISYRLDPQDDRNIVYASVTNGYRSGGYNIQMFSDLLQVSLKNDMMRTLADNPKIGPMMTKYIKVGDNPTADDATVYKPETSWNFEVGSHLNLFNDHLSFQAAVFYIRVNDVQITRFAAKNGLGRQILNAGKSESYGVDLNLSGWFNIAGNPLRLTGNYGFTHATFTDNDAGTADYQGNYVPFAPKHTMSASADYFFPVGNTTFNVGVNTTGVGRVYWTEDNTASEPYFQLLGAHIGCQYKNVTINIWGRNLTDKSYVPFYFESMSRGYAQRCRPRQFGFTVTSRF